MGPSIKDFSKIPPIFDPYHRLHYKDPSLKRMSENKGFDPPHFHVPMNEGFKKFQVHKKMTKTYSNESIKHEEWPCEKTIISLCKIFYEQ